MFLSHHLKSEPNILFGMPWVGLEREKIEGLFLISMWKEFSVYTTRLHTEEAVVGGILPTGSVE